VFASPRRRAISGLAGTGGTAMATTRCIGSADQCRCGRKGFLATYTVPMSA